MRTQEPRAEPNDGTIVGRWGRAAGLAWYAMGMMTLTMLCILLLVAMRLVPGTAMGELAWAYFGGMGIAAGATQLPNTAERLPGQRRWDRPHLFDGSRPPYVATDGKDTETQEES